MRKYFFLGVLLIFSHSAFSQWSIKGKIIDSTKAPIPFATIALVKNQDSSIFKGTITDEKGNYCFSNIKSGDYLLKISTAGFSTMYCSHIKFDSTSSITVPDITLNSQANNLNEISVTAIKKAIEFKNGNITVNIEDSPLAVGNSAYDLLSHLPGVVIDENDNISIQGRQGVKIFIDDRIQQLSDKQLINLLKSISSASIEKIEVLKNPPVKYDASGTAGIINIKTKKVKLIGFSGNASSSYSQGFYGDGSCGLSLNYKGNKITFFSNINFDISQQRFIQTINKKILYNSILTELDQTVIHKALDKEMSYKVGFDWSINKRNIIGIKVDGVAGNYDEYISGNNYISDNSLGFSKLSYNSSNPQNWNLINYNFNAEHIFDTLGTSLKFSTGYSPYNELDKSYSENNFFDNNTEVLKPKIFKAENNPYLFLFSSKLDFEKIFSKTLSLEAGIKTANQNMTNDYILENQDYLTGNYSIDTAFTDRFSYQEHTLAGYINVQKQIEKLNFQFGLRGEKTTANATSQTMDINYNRQYSNLFPLINVEYNRNKNQNFQFSYNRRINRPSYDNFNPYKSFENIFLSAQGNPYILQEYSNTFELTHVYKSRFSNAISYSHLNNYILNYTLQNDSTKETTGYVSNLKYSNTIGYSTSYQTDIEKWWALTIQATASYLNYTGKINGIDFNATGLTCSTFLTNQFLLPEKIKIEINVQYFGPKLDAVYYHKSKWGAHIAFKKSFLNDKLNCVIGVNDIFHTLIGTNQIVFQNQNIDVHGIFDTRRFKISLSYNFGKVKVQEREVNSNDTEKERLKH